MPPGMALIVTTRGSNYRCLEQIFMVPKGFEPSKFDCILSIFRYIISMYANIFATRYCNQLICMVSKVDNVYVVNLNSVAKSSLKCGYVLFTSRKAIIGPSYEMQLKHPRISV